MEIPTPPKTILPALMANGEANCGWSKSQDPMPTPKRPKRITWRKSSNCRDRDHKQNQQSPLSTRFTKLTVIMASLLLLWAGGSGCDKLLAIADHNNNKDNLEQNRGQATRTGADTSTNPVSADPATELERYAEARAEIAHRMKTVQLSEHAQITSEVIGNHGFNHMTFAAASHKYRNNPEADRLTSLASEQYKATEEAAAAEEAARAQQGSADGGSISGEGGGTGSDEQPLLQESENEVKDLSLVSYLTGQWLGNLSGIGGGSGTLRFNMSGNGQISGSIRIIGPENYTLNLEGQISSNRILLKTTGSAPEVNMLELEGTTNSTHNGVTGAWKGKLNRRNIKGSWRATRRG